MLRRHLLWIAGLLFSCSGRVSEPSDLANAVGPVSFRLQNATGADVFIRWRDDLPLYDLNQRGKHLNTSSWCSNPCELGCACLDCSPPSPSVKRVPAGTTLTFEWSGSWYEAVSCSSACSCDQTRAGLPGDYEITVAAARGYAPTGATPLEVEGVLKNADLDLSKGACDAQLTTKLTSGPQDVTLTFSCEPAP